MLKDYPGSKAGEGVWQRIISEMPPHETYIEPFLGSGVIFQKKKPAGHSILIDADPAVIAEMLVATSAGNGDLRDPNAGTGVASGVSVICGDGIRNLQERRWTGRELVYADPPYLMEARSCQRRYYRCELESREEHGRLLDVLCSLPCPVMLSGYFSEFYSQQLTGWRTLQIPTMTHGGPAVEWVWCNFAAPSRLHDDRFIGGNFRERWRIKKRVNRWQARIASLPPLERALLVAAVNAGNGVSVLSAGNGARSAPGMASLEENHTPGNSGVLCAAVAGC